MYDPALLDLLETLPLGPYHGLVWRVTFDGQPPLRANTRGARWNPKDVSALYTSLSVECVRAEFQYLMNSQNPRPSKPASEYTLEVRLERVLDLRSPERLRRLGLDLTSNEDAIESWAPYQRIGGAVSLLGLEGLLVPSVRLVDGVNLVIYTDNVQPIGTSEVTVASSQPFTPAATG